MVRGIEDESHQPRLVPDRWLFFLSLNKQPLGFIKTRADISKILWSSRFLTVEYPEYPDGWVSALEDCRANSVERCRYHQPVDRTDR